MEMVVPKTVTFPFATTGHHLKRVSWTRSGHRIIAWTRKDFLEHPQAVTISEKRLSPVLVLSVQICTSISAMLKCIPLLLIATLGATSPAAWNPGGPNHDSPVLRKATGKDVFALEGTLVTSTGIGMSRRRSPIKHDI